MGVADDGAFLELSFGAMPFVSPKSLFIENVIGTPWGDTIRGNAAANWLEGRGGNDVLEGRGGNDDLIGGLGNDTYVFSGAWLGADTIREFSGQGTDTLDFRGFAYEIAIDLANKGRQTVKSSHLSLQLDTGIAYASTHPFIENVQGSEFADTIRGNNRDNKLWGNGGNDLLFGEDGLDWLFGGDGDDELDGGNDSYQDRLDGGAGADIFYYWLGKTEDDAAVTAWSPRRLKADDHRLPAPREQRPARSQTERSCGLAVPSRPRLRWPNDQADQADRAAARERSTRFTPHRPLRSSV
jgi:hypothetical protein